MRIDAALQWITDQLSDKREAKYLMAACLDIDFGLLWAHPEQELSLEQLSKLTEWLEQRKQGYPLAYLTGKQGFWTFDLMVTEQTLVPRPETELLVEKALEMIPGDQTVNVLDLGTGSGAIAIAIALERPLAQVVAVDANKQTLSVAEQNAQRLQVPNLEFCLSNWFERIEGEYHVIVSNPPYVESGFEGLSALRFEPQEALVAGEDGLTDLSHIIRGAPDYLGPQGSLLLEHGYAQGPAVRSMLSTAGFADVQTFNDLAALPRMSIGRLID